MNAENLKSIKPFVSLLLIIGSLLFLVFLRMEERRLGYEILRATSEYKKLVDQKRGYEIILAKVTRPQLLDSWAQRKLTLKKIEANQIIHLSIEGGSFSRKEM